MLKANYHKDFKKDYKKLPKKIQSKFDERFLIFLQNPHEPTLKDHVLSGVLKGKRAFSITGDVRCIYRYLTKNEVVLLRLGSHNQVY